MEEKEALTEIASMVAHVTSLFLIFCGLTTIGFNFVMMLEHLNVNEVT